MKTFRKTLALLSALVLFAGLALGCAAEQESMSEEERAMNMKLGWNLGNTFDAPDGEISWGNPFTTPELIYKIKELGFDTIRIPISWGKHNSGAPDYTIDASYMKRVTTVVNTALDAGLFVIINSHHDNDIYTPKADNAEQGKAYLGAIWPQIAENFKDADHHLIFQTMNEPRVVGAPYEWNIMPGNKDFMDAVEVNNQLNQVCLDAIRATGGKNADRFVMICPYAGIPEAATLSAFRMPEDSVEGRLMLSVHAYRPYNLVLNVNSPESAFKVTMITELKAFMKTLNYMYVSKGVPVIIDEMGIINKNNPEDRHNWAKAFVATAQEYGMPCVWWDNGYISDTGESFAIINRRKLELYEQSRSTYEGLFEGLNK